MQLRIALADRPGALARVASIIAEHGGNISSVDVHRAGIVSAVDDFVVDFPEGSDLLAMRNDLTASGAATLVSDRESEPGTDLVVTTLQRAADMIAARTGDPDAELVRAVGEVCAAPVVWVSTTEEARRYEAGRFALERSGPIALRTTELPDEFGDRLLGEAWLLAVPDPVPLRGGRVVFVARLLRDEFTSTEIARVAAVMVLLDQVDRLLSQP